MHKECCLSDCLIANLQIPKLSFASGNPQHRQTRQLVTCPGFPGYCSESYVGDTCTVVCARGRNNVPQCQVVMSRITEFCRNENFLFFCP